MRAKIKYAFFVKEDIKEAVNWYNKAQNGLGTRFLKNVKEKINSVAKNPETIQIRYNDVQIAVVNTFPYTIHFQFHKEQNTIFILGIFHTSKNPENWIERL
ncbi:type II toxin-antitoxin system RelE/ParE family toxin [Flavobacterium sp.]|uniref:type II toxin-antitoxin system RelE/ParE family toxin n=1 Tax=Flavobacterium sp. TaxID=239 RepID=UPI0033416251